ncbi:MAG: hypothetical protein IJP92_06775, partial [Lachnospiraceae bacterium]|nr:hypothetical protein [Lachnospiraceae bacterium]
MNLWGREGRSDAVPGHGGGHETFVNTGFPAQGQKQHTRHHWRARRAVSAVLTAVLLFVCAFSGALSALPGIGDAFKPLTAHAAPVQIGGGTWTYNGANITDGNNNSKSLQSTDVLQVNSSGATIVLEENLTLGKLIILGDTVIQVNDHELKIEESIGGGDYIELTMEGVSANHGSVSVGNASLQGSAIAVYGLTVKNMRFFRAESYDGSAIYTRGGD